MTKEQLIRTLNEIPSGDCEHAHGQADAALLLYFKTNGMPDVEQAYDALVDRCKWWACA